MESHLHTLSPDDPTLDAPSSSSSECTPAACGRIALVEGSGPQLSGETHALLRSRLRSAALLIAAGFGVFLVRNFFLLERDDPRDLYVFGGQAVVVAILALTAVSLCRRCSMSGTILRFKELLIFGLPALFFLLAQYAHLTDPKEHHGMLEGHAGPWMTLIFTYAMFVPTTWRRAAVVVVTMAAMPMILFTTFWLVGPASGAINVNQLSGMFLMLVVTELSAIWGVYTIGRLRREAFEARKFGQYRLRQMIGAGGMGEVYLAEHQLMKRPCAIKIIRPSKAGDPQAMARFEREVRATARLSHWNTVEIFDYGRTDDGTFYYVMEFLPGLSLSDLVEHYGPLPAERVVHLLSQTCDALSEAHGIGLIHRDIKPGNIFAAQRGGVFDVAKLLDFGLARCMRAEMNSQLTQEGSITGSPLYMSPEQATGDRPPDARSDIYALGAVAYFLLTGRPPFNDERPLKVMIAHATAEPTPPSQFKPDVPADLEDVVLRCLAKEPDDRYADTTQLAAALAACDSAGRWTRQQAHDWWNRSIGPTTTAPRDEVESAIAAR